MQAYLRNSSARADKDRCRTSIRQWIEAGNRLASRSRRAGYRRTSFSAQVFGVGEEVRSPRKLYSKTQTTVVVRPAAQAGTLAVHLHGSAGAGLCPQPHQSPASQ